MNSNLLATNMSTAAKEPVAVMKKFAEKPLHVLSKMMNKKNGRQIPASAASMLKGKETSSVLGVLNDYEDQVLPQVMFQSSNLDTTTSALHVQTLLEDICVEWNDTWNVHQAYYCFFSSFCSFLVVSSLSYDLLIYLEYTTILEQPSNKPNKVTVNKHGNQIYKYLIWAFNQPSLVMISAARVQFRT
jgi:hypothetical protein